MNELSERSLDELVTPPQKLAPLHDDVADEQPRRDLCTARLGRGPGPLGTVRDLLGRVDSFAGKALQINPATDALQTKKCCVRNQGAKNTSLVFLCVFFNFAGLCVKCFCSSRSFSPLHDGWNAVQAFCWRSRTFSATSRKSMFCPITSVNRSSALRGSPACS